MNDVGIDEAGRGPVMGPLVVALAVVPVSLMGVLVHIGVKDSKLFGTPRKAHYRRRSLCEEVKKLGVSMFAKVYDASVVDKYVREHNLNGLEREGAIALLNQVDIGPAERVICDGVKVFGPLQQKVPNLIAENHAETKYVAVAVASLFAKVTRDLEMHRIYAKYEPEFGPIEGAGYQGIYTDRFLDQYGKRYGYFPKETRRSWFKGAVGERENALKKPKAS